MWLRVATALASAGVVVVNSLRRLKKMDGIDLQELVKICYRKQREAGHEIDIAKIFAERALKEMGLNEDAFAQAVGILHNTQLEDDHGST